MLKLTIEELDLRLSRIYSHSFEKRTESLRRKLSDSPTQESDWTYDFTRLVIKERRSTSLIGLALLSWYMTDEMRALLQLELESKRVEGYSYELMEILLNSKEFALSWLILQEKWNEFDLFGNVLDRRLARAWSQVDFAKKSTRKVRRYTGYCRGYRESSRRAPSPLPLELRAKLTVEEEFQRKLVRELTTQSWIERVRTYLAS